MGYYIDLVAISISKYRDILKSADLLPSRMILKENIDEVFQVLKKQQIKNVDELQKTLKSKDKVQSFSKKSAIPEGYLTILSREIKSYRQKPNILRDFPGIDKNEILKLENLGIKNTLQLFGKIITPQSRKELAAQTGINESGILKLAKLADLSRIRWVNHTFAYVLFEAGFDTSEKVATANYEELYTKVKTLNEERKIYKAHIGLHDMKLCVEAAKDVSLDIKY